MKTVMAAAFRTSRDALPDAVSRVDARELDALSFTARFVAPSLPVLLTHAVDDWRALGEWADGRALVHAAGDAVVMLSTTPDGRADSVSADAFRLPYETHVPLRSALHALGNCCGVAYISAQSDSLRRETPQLLDAVNGGASRLSGALGALEAVNLWISRGQPRPVSSWHCDHYDNLHTVVAGEKTFALLPPHSAGVLRKRRVAPARWAHDDHACERATRPLDPDCASGRDCWSLSPAPDALPPGETTVPWTSARADEVAALSPFIVRVAAGETLFIPALWYHEVTSGSETSGLTIAVNAWHEAPSLGGLAAAALFAESLAAAT